MINYQGDLVLEYQKINKHLTETQKCNNPFPQNIIELAVRGLENMYVPEKNLFCTRAKRTEQGVLKEGLSYRYTVISTLGLHQYETQGGKSPINIQVTLSFLIKRASEICYIGDLGLLLWLCALAFPEQLPQLYSYINQDNVLVRYRDAYKGQTTELAWFLAGLSHAVLACNPAPIMLKRLAAETYKLLLKNYGDKGIFGHMHKNTINGLTRARIGSFADQIYPIYAFSIFANAFNNEEASNIALECANAICRLQGPLGQWWWHYDAFTGEVIGQYPVYATHQDGMAPMALFTIGEITGQDFSHSIYRGLEWINRKNELDFEFIDTSRNVIWRSIYKSKHKIPSDEILALLRINNRNTDRRRLKINWECRPYHLGWILYAFSNNNNNFQNLNNNGVANEILRCLSKNNSTGREQGR